MFCHRKSQIEPYTDGMLDSSHRVAFERHLSRCSSCRKGVAEACDARRCMNWLVSEEAPPQPRADFYDKVQQSIERETAAGWLANLAATMRLQLAYPLAVICLLLVAFSLTQEGIDVIEVYDALAATEYPSADFVEMSFAGADESYAESYDRVMMTLVELPED